MKQSKAEIILRDPGKYAHHDRIFLNNPVIMQGMGLAPVVILATSGRNALMLAVAVALLLTPSRVLSFWISKLVPLQEHASEEELRAKLLPRGLIYCGTASVVYLIFYPLLQKLFGMDLLTLGIYLPMLVVEPLIIYRYGRVQEKLRKAVSKGLRVTVGYCVILLVVGCIREWLASGTVFRVAVTANVALLPVASMPAGGFILLGVLSAVWRALAARYRAFLANEARNQVIVNHQKEARRES